MPIWLLMMNPAVPAQLRHSAAAKMRMPDQGAGIHRDLEHRFPACVPCSDSLDVEVEHPAAGMARVTLTHTRRSRAVRSCGSLVARLCRRLLGCPAHAR